MANKNLYRVTIEITNLRDSFIGQSCYLAGNFNQWSAHQHRIGEIPELSKSIQMELHDIEAGTLELKLTRGDWSSLNCSKEGHLLAPYSIDIFQDTYIHLSIDAWRDEFPISTMTPEVHLFKEDFYFPKLNKKLKVWVYLPQNYADSAHAYPVIYMHDGQHLFDEATSVGRAGPVEWQVDKAINESTKDAIVVAIAHPETYSERQAQYLVHPFEEYTNPLGSLYLEDIVEVLKPAIDAQYRTLTDRAHTAMVGSSLGGLLTLYAGLLFPEVFGNLGVFSPSIWMDRAGLKETFARCIHASAIQEQRYFFYAGDLEKRKQQDISMESMSMDMCDFALAFKQLNKAEVFIDINPHGKHGALYWQKAFPRFYDWFHQREFFTI